MKFIIHSVLVVLALYFSILNAQGNNECESGTTTSRDSSDTRTGGRYSRTRRDAHDELRGAEDYIQATSGAVYIRWGRTTCPSISELIYEGYTAGGWFLHKGGGSNFLCLPLSSEFDEINPGTDGDRAYVYSAEYKIANFLPFASKHNHDAPCAVCRAEYRGSVVTIPGKMTCPPGWAKEYYGYLMTSDSDFEKDYHVADFVCVDRNPESIPGGNEERLGAFLYPVEVKCDYGNLPCASYPSGQELSCVVCTI